MNLKKFFSLFISFVFCVFLFWGVSIHSKPDSPYVGKPIHIFYEGLATQPALLGMVDMLRLPADELKLFAWHRFPNRDKLFDLKSVNAVEIPIAERESYAIISAYTFMDNIKKYLDENPDSPVIVYTNINNVEYFFPKFLSVVPKDRIKHIHLYEDGFGSIVTFLNKYMLTPDLSKVSVELEKFLYQPTDYQMPDYGKIAIHRLFPTTYYFGALDKIKKDSLFAVFVNRMKDAEMKNIDYGALKNTLTTRQKKKLFQLAGFDLDKYRSLMQNKKTLMFFGGYYVPENHHYNHAELHYMLQLQQQYPEYVFLLKSHPSYDSFDRTKVVGLLNKDIEIIPAQIPYELFIIAGLEPTKTAGSASSLFYNLSDKSIVGYFPHRAYASGFVLIKHFDMLKSLNIQSYVPKEPLFYDEKVRINNKPDYAVTVDDNNIFMYNQRKNYTVLKQTDNIIVLKENNHKGLLGRKEKSGYRFISIPLYQLKHTNWEDFLAPVGGGKICRQTGTDCGKVTVVGNILTVCWDKWGCESFRYRTKEETYRLVTN